MNINTEKWIKACGLILVSLISYYFLSQEGTHGNYYKPLVKILLFVLILVPLSIVSYLSYQVFRISSHRAEKIISILLASLALIIFVVFTGLLVLYLDFRNFGF